MGGAAGSRSIHWLPCDPGEGGCWIARARDPDTGKQQYNALGELTETFGYDAAVKAAREWFASLDAGVKTQERTTRKKTGEVVAQMQVQLGGMNYTPTPAEYHAEAWKTAIDDKLVEANAHKDDFNFEIVPVTLGDAFSHSQPKGKSS